MQVNIKKTLTLLEKISNLEFRRENSSFALIELPERFVIGTFFIKLTQFEKTGSTDKVFTPLKI